MADNKDGESFFRKVVRFVANPATDWADLGTKQDDTRELDLEKSELKAMVESRGGYLNLTSTQVKRYIIIVLISIIQSRLS